MAVTPENSTRLYYLDNMRAIASIMGVVYHVALIFGSPWRINIDDIERGKLLFVVINFLNLYRIPTFLLVAGFFTLYAVKKYNIITYIKRRFNRIVIPFIASCIILLPVQAFFTVKFNDSGHYWLNEFLGSINPIHRTYSLQHLWFLYDIILFSIVGLILYNLKRFKVISWMFRFFSKFQQNLFVVIGIWTSIQYIFIKIAQYYDATFPVNEAWFTMINSALYLPFFLFGSFCFLRKDLMENKFINGKIVNIILLSFLFAALLILDLKLSSFGLLIEIAYRWTMMFLVINLVKALLNYSNRFLTYISNASYPFYILHQPVIVVIGFFYVKHMFFTSILMNYFFLVIVCILVTYLIYEIAIRRNKFGTILFTGVFPKKTK